MIGSSIADDKGKREWLHVNRGERAVMLLKELVAIPTYEGEEEGVRYVYDWSRKIGLDAAVQPDANEVPLNCVIAAGKPGTGALLFNSHVDTVPPGDLDLWATDPLQPTEKGGRLYGLGACDAKGSVAAMMSAFADLASEARRTGRSLLLTVVGAEERGQLGTRLTVREGIAAGGAVVGEPTSLVPKRACKGVLRVEIVVHGKAGHASDPGSGANAVYGASAIALELEAFAEELAGRSPGVTGVPSLAVTLAEGGTAHNVVPERCSLAIDRRLVPGEQVEEAMEQIKAIAHRATEGRRGIRVEFDIVRVLGAAETPPEERIARLAQEALSSWGAPSGRCAAKSSRGRGVVDWTEGAAIGGTSPGGIDSWRSEGFTACCDMCTLHNEARIPSVVWGPGEISVVHKPDESIAIDEVSAASEAYYRLGMLWLEGCST